MAEQKLGWLGHDQNELLRDIAHTFREFEKDFDEFLKLLRTFVKPQPAVAVRATLTYTIKGESPMATTPLALFVGQTATPTFAEFDANGNAVPVVGPVTYAADASGAISVDPNTGIVTGVTPTPTDGSVATSTATDANNSLTASASFTVSAVAPPPAVSATLTYVANPLPASVRARVKKQ